MKRYAMTAFSSGLGRDGWTTGKLQPEWQRERGCMGEGDLDFDDGPGDEKKMGAQP